MVNSGLSWSAVFAVVLFVMHAAVIVRVFLRPHREPTSRVTWAVMIIALPVAGMLGYLLFGEVSIGRRRVARMHQVIAGLPDVNAPVRAAGGDAVAVLRPRIDQLFRAGFSINGFEPAGANRARLMADSNANIDAMVADIDAARESVHICFYIWLADGNGLKVVHALKRAAARGVACRAMADDLGSRKMIASRHWAEMTAAGVALQRALPIGNPLLRPFRGRIDLRNHRKIVVIDNWITYCGSQNCADPEFRVKAKFAPWVDAVMRFEGPVARQNQHLFAADWTTHSGEDLGDLLRQPLPQAVAHVDGGFVAQAVGTGPTSRFSAMPELFETLIFAARRELTVTTPYYVPNEALQAAFCAAANRGVETRLILPAVNDSRFVSAASRSCYRELLTAGVRIFEYRGGLLHAKTLTLDGEVTLIGSANMDRRSFDLNYENNILLHDRALTAVMRARQEEWLASSNEVTQAAVAAWGWRRELAHNFVALLGPIL